MAERKGNYRHGMYGTPTYKSWAEMKHRCKHPEHSTGKYEVEKALTTKVVR